MMDFMTYLTVDRVNSDIADILFVDVAELSASTNLADIGLESVRLHTLVDIWRAVGAEVTFRDLGNDLTLGRWYEVLCGHPVTGQTTE